MEKTGKFIETEVMTLAEIAGYLKVSRKTIFRMAKEGEIPGTKVSNQWRFLRSVINDWLSAKMQSAPKQELVRVIKTARKIIPMARLISSDRILLGLLPGTKESVLRQLIKPLLTGGIIADSEELLHKLIERENMVATAIGHGIALPHVRDPEEIQLKEPCIVLGICKDGTDFESVDGEKTYVFALLCSNSEVVHLRLMAKISLLLRDPEIVNKMRTARNNGEVASLLIDADTELRSFF